MPWAKRGNLSNVWAKVTRSFQSETRKKDSMIPRRELCVELEKILYVDVRDPDALPMCEFTEFMNSTAKYLDLLFNCSSHKNIEELRRRAMTWVEPYPEEGPWHGFDEELNGVINTLDFKAHADHLLPVSISVEFPNDYRVKITNIVHRLWKFDWKLGLPTHAVVTVRQRTAPYESEYRIESLSQLKVVQLTNNKLCIYIRGCEDSDKLVCSVIVGWIPGDLDSIVAERQELSTENNLPETEIK